jgi:hypothetical protein
LDKDNSFCWDAAPCRLRYAWKGGFIDGFPYWKGNGDALAQIKGTVNYVEDQSPFGDSEVINFLGYSMKDQLPVFRYQVGSKTISESIRPLTQGVGFTRIFAISPVPSSPITLNFSSSSECVITSDKGKIVGKALTLQPADAAKFTLTFSTK